MVPLASPSLFIIDASGNQLLLHPALSEVGTEDRVLRTDGLDALGGFLGPEAQESGVGAAIQLRVRPATGLARWLGASRGQKPHVGAGEP